MTQSQKNAKRQKLPKSEKNITQITSFLTKLKKTEREIFAFCVITFEPIKTQTRSAPQNDCLNFSFVKDTPVVGEKMARKGWKMAIYQSQILRNSLLELTVLIYKLCLFAIMKRYAAKS